MDAARRLLAAAVLAGLSIADFNPDLDPDGQHARRVVALFRRLLPRSTG